MKCTGKLNTDSPPQDRVKKLEAKRRKAVFSCDRCKTRKRKCIRFITTEDNEKIPTFDIIYPCQDCIQSNSICYTYLGQRKQTTLKKLSIPENMVTDEDRNQDADTRIKNLEVKCQYLTNLLKQISPSIKTELFKHDETKPKPMAMILSSNTSNSPMDTSKLKNSKEETEMDNLDISSIDHNNTLKDLNENSSIKPMMTSTNLRDTVIELIGSPDSLKSVTTDLAQSTTSEPVFNIHDLKMRRYDNDHLVYTIPRDEADGYVCDYFDKVHPICNCIDKDEFVRTYELFWLLLQHEDLRSINSVLFLSSPQICTIYLIWILGKKFKNADDPSLINSYSQIIQKTLSENLLNPSEAGIQMGILFSFYLESTHSRESAWILIETAVTQAIAIGMNKTGRLSSSRNDVENKKKNSTKIWCTLFAQEIRLSNIMGRQSSIDFSEVDISTPKFKKNNNSSNLPRYWFHEINCDDYQSYFDNYYSLNRIFHEFLSYRSSVMEETSIYTVSSLKKAWELRRKFHIWIKSLPTKLKNIFDQEPTNIANYKVYLHLTYHYYFINLGLPFLMLILRLMQSERHVKLKNSDPIYILAISAVNCSKQLYNIIKYEFDNRIFNGSVYNDIYILYHSTLIFTIAIIVVSHEKVNATLDTKHLETKGNISKEKMWHIICKVGELNKRLQPSTSGSNLEISKTIDLLVEHVSHFLDHHGHTHESHAKDHISTHNEQQKIDDNTLLHTSSSNSFNSKMNNLFNTMYLDTDELWKLINNDYSAFEDEEAMLFKEFNRLDNYFID